MRGELALGFGASRALKVTVSGWEPGDAGHAMRTSVRAVPFLGGGRCAQAERNGRSEALHWRPSGKVTVLG